MLIALHHYQSSIQQPDIGRTSQFLRTPPVCIQCPVSGFLSEYCHNVLFHAEKLEFCGYPMVSFRQNTWTWQMDRETSHDGNEHRLCSCIASHGKKWSCSHTRNCISTPCPSPWSLVDIHQRIILSKDRHKYMVSNYLLCLYTKALLLLLLLKK